MFKRNVVIVLAVLLCALPSAIAQTKPGFGIKGGIALSNQDWEYSDGFDPGDRDRINGLAFGVFTDFALTPVVTLRPEALYVQKGSQMDFPVTDEANDQIGTVTYKDQIDYLSVLVTAKVQPPLITGLDFYFLGGPRLDFKVSADSDDTSAVMTTIIDSYKDVVTGLTFGVGLERKIGPTAKLLLEVRYDLDLSDAMVLDNSVNDLYIDNKTFAVLAGISF
jgi:hypothetical protein